MIEQNIVETVSTQAQTLLGLSLPLEQDLRSRNIPLPPMLLSPTFNPPGKSSLADNSQHKLTNPGIMEAGIVLGGALLYANRNKHVSRRRFLRGAGATTIAGGFMVADNILGRGGRTASAQNEHVATIQESGQTYSAGWNFVAFPQGTDLQAIQASGVDLSATYILRDNQWQTAQPDDFARGVMINFSQDEVLQFGDGSDTTTQIDMPAGQWTLVGNRNGKNAMNLKGVDAAYDLTPQGYKTAPFIGIGRAVLAYSATGGKATLETILPPGRGGSDTDKFTPDASVRKDMDATGFYDAQGKGPDYFRNAFVAETADQASQQQKDAKANDDYDVELVAVTNPANVATWESHTAIHTTTDTSFKTKTDAISLLNDSYVQPLVAGNVSMTEVPAGKSAIYDGASTVFAFSPENNLGQTAKGYQLHFEVHVPSTGKLNPKFAALASGQQIHVNLGDDIYFLTPDDAGTLKNNPNSIIKNKRPNIFVFSYMIAPKNVIIPSGHPNPTLTSDFKGLLRAPDGTNRIVYVNNSSQ